MVRKARFVFALSLLVVLTAATVATTSAGGRKILDSTMAGLPTGSLPLDGLTGGGVPGASTTAASSSSPTAASTSRSRAS